MAPKLRLFAKLRAATPISTSPGPTAPAFGTSPAAPIRSSISQAETRPANAWLTYGSRAAARKPQASALATPSCRSIPTGPARRNRCRLAVSAFTCRPGSRGPDARLGESRAEPAPLGDCHCHSLGEAVVQIGVGSAVDFDLDHACAGRQGSGDLVQ